MSYIDIECVSVHLPNHNTTKNIDYGCNQCWFDGTSRYYIAGTFAVNTYTNTHRHTMQPNDQNNNCKIICTLSNKNMHCSKPSTMQSTLCRSLCAITTVRKRKMGPFDRRGKNIKLWKKSSTSV